MKTFNFPAALFLGCILSISNSQVAWGKLYKWVDEHGNVSFSDQVPPEEVKHRRETLNREGRVVEITEQEKTKEQQEKERLLNLLRKKQERIIKNQKTHDESLLRTYHSKAEMLEELEVKLQPMQGKINLYESELKNQIDHLDTKQKDAATFERNAQKVPASLVKQIKTIQAEVDKTKQNITEVKVQQDKLRKEYENNIKRFLILTQSSDASNQDDKVSSIEEEGALGLFRCENDHQCTKAWEIARVFVDSYSTTPPDINTENLVMHALPSKGSDYSLSISKISGKNNEYQLFMDIHCHESSVGKELCKSKKIQELRSSFRPYVNDRLSNKVPTP